MDRPARRIRLGRLLTVSLVGVLATACGTATGTSAPPPIPTLAVATPGASAAPSAAVATETVPTPASPTPDVGAPASQPPDTGGGASQGDIPDNAVFLTFRDAGSRFTIEYVEGWQVSAQLDGVVIRDKDSSETVTVVTAPPDLARFVSGTDLPSLEAQAGFALVRRDAVTVGSGRYTHLVYHLPAPPDPVTGKRVPSTVDRFYVPGPRGLAIVSLSTPDGVDNVDAFRQMIESFRWL